MQESEYNEVMNTIRSTVKTIVGIFFIVISSIILYTMYNCAEWWIIHANDFIIGLSITVSLLLLGIGVILACDKLNRLLFLQILVDIFQNKWFVRIVYSPLVFLI